MPSTLVEAFELLVDVEQLAPRLDAAATALDQLPGLDVERGWLAAARERLATVRGTSYDALLDRSVRLAELESMRGDRGKRLQGAVADEVEKLQAAITLAGTSRSPLLEVLFLNLKVPVLRKCGKPELDKFCTDLEQRLASSYAKRLFAGEHYRVVVPNVSAFHAAVGTWRSVFVDPPLEGEAAQAMKDELMTAATAVELPIRQARLLAEAALMPARELLDAAGVLTAKGKRKAKGDAHPMLENDPPDPDQPTTDERAELGQLG